MTTDKIEFTWSDVWLLQAIALTSSKEPATLKGTIAVGDAINHAIFTFAEVQAGLARLLAAGYIIHEADKFSLSSTFREEFARLSKNRGIRKQSDAIEKYLHAPSWHAGYDPHKLDPNWSYPGVTQEEFDKACEAYNQSFWASYRNRKKKQNVTKK